MQPKAPLDMSLDLVPVLLVIGLEEAPGVLDPLALQVSLLGEVDGVLCSQLVALWPVLVQPSLAEPGNFVLPPSLLLGPGSSLGSWWLRGDCLSNCLGQACIGWSHSGNLCICGTGCFGLCSW